MNEGREQVLLNIDRPEETDEVILQNRVYDSQRSLKVAYDNVDVFFIGKIRLISEKKEPDIMCLVKPNVSENIEIEVRA